MHLRLSHRDTPLPLSYSGLESSCWILNRWTFDQNIWEKASWKIIMIDYSLLLIKSGIWQAGHTQKEDSQQFQNPIKKNLHGYFARNSRGSPTPDYDGWVWWYLLGIHQLQQDEQQEEKEQRKTALRGSSGADVSRCDCRTPRKNVHWLKFRADRMVSDFQSH